MLSRRMGKKNCTLGKKGIVPGPKAKAYEKMKKYLFIIELLSVHFNKPKKEPVF
jgi:hypothetical protein